RSRPSPMRGGAFGWCFGHVRLVAHGPTRCTFPHRYVRDLDCHRSSSWRLGQLDVGCSTPSFLLRGRRKLHYASVVLSEPPARQFSRTARHRCDHHYFLLHLLCLFGHGCWWSLL